ncbi:MAG: hypothetical protein JJE30_18070 [Desulfuromonadales bacterium]|nr:hypothetical protein [Desulfuromonadales bacterium]
MNTIETLHNEAMDLAELAHIAKSKDDRDTFLELSKKAFELEKKAALAVAQDFTLEPTRSILCRSAASLAMDCTEYREAEKLISLALWGNPPINIAEELRDLLETVQFSRHLETKGMELAGSEFQMSLSGKAIGHGVISSKEFIDRVDFVEKLLFRTAERKKGKPFKERGRKEAGMKEDLQLFLSAPRAASFAITFKFGQSKDQPHLPEIDPAIVVVDEVLECVKLVNEGNDAELKTRINDEAYLQNFLALTKQIAPDGNQITQVGFTVSRNGKTTQTPLTVPKDKISIIGQSKLPSNEVKRISVTGSLRYANSMKSMHLIKLVDNDGKSHNVVVPEGMMTDIVKPLWEDVVVVTGVKIGREIHLEDIKKSEN